MDIDQRRLTEQLMFLALGWIISISVLTGRALGQTTAVLHLADAQWSNAQLVDVTNEGKFRFQSEKKQHDVELSKIVRWSTARPIQPSSAVWLPDGSWLSGSIQWLSERSLRLNSEWFEPLELKLDEVRAVILQPSPAYRQSLELHAKMVSLTGASDTIWNVDAERLQGVLSGQWRVGTAVASGKPIWFLKPNGREDKVELRENELQAMTFSPVLRKPLGKPSQLPMITLRDGSRLNISVLKRASNNRLQLELADGYQLASLDPVDQFLPAIASVTGEPLNTDWLSELDPARYRLLDEGSLLDWPLGRDVDLFGNRIWSSGLPVEHSLVVHSPAQVAYRWDGRPGRFLSEIQLWHPHSVTTQHIGSARCQVLLARGGELKPAFQSEVLRPGDAPALIDIEITGAQLVVLLVEAADLGTMGDHVLWREARFVTQGQR